MLKTTKCKLSQNNNYYMKPCFWFKELRKYYSTHKYFNQYYFKQYYNSSKYFFFNLLLLLNFKYV